MNQSEFEADLKHEGYEVFYGGQRAGHANPDHSHDWHARVMVIGGEIPGAAQLAATASVRGTLLLRSKARRSPLSASTATAKSLRP